MATDDKKPAKKRLPQGQRPRPPMLISPTLIDAESTSQESPVGDGYEIKDYGDMFTNLKALDTKVSQLLEKDPFHHAGKLIGDKIFTGAYDTAEDIAKQVLYERAELKKLGTYAAPSDVPLEEVAWLLDEAAKRFATDEYHFYRDAMKRIYAVDAFSSLILSKGGLGVIWRSLANPPKKGDYRPNEGLSLIGELEDIAFAYSLVDATWNMSKGHRAYKEGLKETVTDLIKNPYVQEEFKLIGISLAIPVVASAFNTGDPAGYFHENFGKKLAHFVEKKPELSGDTKGKLETAAKKYGMSLDQLLMSKAPEELRVLIGEELKQNTSAFYNMIHGSLETMQDAYVSAQDMIPEGIKSILRKSSRLVFLGLNLGETALMSYPFNSHFWQRAMVRDVMDLTAQSLYENRPLEGYAVKQLPEKT